jgi:hypothetical protein
MTPFGRSISLALPLLTSIAACAATDAADQQSDSSEDQLQSRPVSAAECSAFQNKHPVTRTATLSTGQTVGVPLRTCDANITGIFGTIDLAFAQQIMAGSGYVPLEVVQQNQPPQAILRLYVNNFLEDDLGPYRSLDVQIDSVPEDSPAEVKTLSWVNPMSAMIPVFDPKVSGYFYAIILTQGAGQADLAYGRELLGTDSRSGSSTSSTQATTRPSRSSTNPVHPSSKG